MVDADNFRTAAARVCTDAKIATIGPSNIDSVEVMYVSQSPPLGLQPPPRTAHQRHQMPVDICKSILWGPEKKATGATCDSLDLFINLTYMHMKEINNDLCTLFVLMYNNLIPEPIQQLLTDTYLFCSYKDPEDLTKLRLLGVPSALRRIIASHVIQHTISRFVHRLLPINAAVGVDGGMDFIIKTMQLSIEKFITQPQEYSHHNYLRGRLSLPTPKYVQLCITGDIYGHH